MNIRTFDEYDRNKIEKAKKLLIEVYEFNYGHTYTKKQWKRLETIISKIEELQEIATNAE